MKENVKDVLCRAGKTFWQAGLGYLLADAAVLRPTLPAGESVGSWALTLLVGALAAGFSAVYNGIVKPLLGGDGHGKL